MTALVDDAIPPKTKEHPTEILYHWSPTERYSSIKHDGLVPGKLSTDRLWRPPVICLSSDPWAAWWLSGKTSRGQATHEWDLWLVYTHEIMGWEIIPYDDGEPREYRVYERIYKRNIHFLGRRAK